MKKKKVSRLLFQYDSDLFYLNFWKKLLHESYYPIVPFEDAYQVYLHNVFSLLESFYSLEQMLEFYFLFLLLFQQNFFSLIPFQYQNIQDRFYAGKCVLAGRGNFFHISHFFQDILHCSNQSLFHSFYLESYLPRSSLKNDKNAFIGRNGRMYFPSNHGMILTVSPIDIFIFDPSKQDIINSYQLLSQDIPFSCYSIFQNTEVAIIPESLVSEDLSKNQIISYLLRLQKQQLLSKKELQIMKTDVQLELIKHQDILMDFQNKNRKTLQEIGKYLSKKKEVKKN